MKLISTKLSRYLIVLGLLCVLGETPLRLYGHLRLIEDCHVDASSESDLLAFFDLALDQGPILISPVGLSFSLFEPSTPTEIQDLPLIIGASSIPFLGRSLGGCGS